MKVLLTGYAGLLGRHLARTLKNQGFVVRVVLHRKTVSRREFAEEVDEVVWGSIHEPGVIESSLAGIDLVVHSAWAFSRQSTRRPTINEIATERLFDRCTAGNIKKFAFISSVAVYGMSAGGPDALSEGSPLAEGEDLAFIYPAEKLSIERFLMSRKRNTTQLGIFRPGPLFDEHKTPLKKLVRLFGVPVAVGFGTGRNHMPFVHAADAASAVVAWLKNGRGDLTVNLTPSSCLPHREWYKRWGTANGLKVRTVFIRGGVLVIAAMGASILKRILGKPGEVDVRYAIASASRNLTYTNQRALDELGWIAVKTNRLSQGQETRT